MGEAERLKVAARGITRRFGTVVANRAIDLDVHAGEFLTLLGPHRSGKTTLLRIIAGLETCDEGAVWIDGRDVTQEPPRSRRVGMVFQQSTLFPHMTVRENVGYGPRVQGRPPAEVDAAVKRALELVRLPDVGDRRPAQLSDGLHLRIALARALATDPSLLAMDEPLGALDPQLRSQMHVELRRIHRETGVTILYVTRDQEQALRMSDRIAVLHDGVLEQVAEPLAIYERPATAFVAHLVGDVALVPCEPVSGRSNAAWLGGDGAPALVEVVDAVPAEPFLLVVRPEHVRLIPGGGSVTGQIAEVTPEGGTTLYEVEVRGYRLKARVLGGPAPAVRIGAKVGVTIEGARTCLPRS